MKNLVKVLAAFVSVIAISVVAHEHGAKKETLEERIKPAGTLCMAGDDCAAAPVADTGSSGPRSGQSIYDTKCSSCHATGAAGAPKLGDATAWAPRIEKGMDVLYDSAINGFNGMPAKGLCFDCSDDELSGAVDHMVENSK